jgi:general secretion pathway protein G
MNGGMAKQRGDTAQVVQRADHRVYSWKPGSRRESPRGSGAYDGFTLIELVISITIMTILTLGVIPLVKVSVKRQQEQQLRETLRAIRSAIDEFHRDTVGMVCTSGVTTGQQQQTAAIDPRSRVVLSDCTIFGVDNPDRYPPDLDTLVNGVNVIPRAPNTVGGGGLGVGNSGTSTLNSESSTKKKVYLRQLPIDPMTGKQDWDLRSCYDAPDTDSTGGENVFDVRSKSKDKALNGENYRDW